MTKEDIASKVIAIISEHSLEKVKVDSTRNSLGLDSSDEIEITMAVEEELDIEISNQEASMFISVGDLVNCVWSKVRNANVSYFKVDYGNWTGEIVYSWDGTVVKEVETSRERKCYTPDSFNTYIKNGTWILCNKDGKPLSEAECLKKLLDFAQDDIDNGRVSDIGELKNKLSLKKKSSQKKKSKESQWTHTISERKFNRCVDQYCVNIQKDFSGKGLDIYYNPETNTIYRGIYNCKKDIIFVAEHLDKCNNPNIVNFYKEMYESCGKSSKIVSYLGDDKYQIEGEILCDKISGVLGESVEDKGEWTDKHYNFTYDLKEGDIKQGVIKIDPYFVNEVWGLNKKDSTGIIFHCLKTLARWTDKNPEEREIRALYGQIKRLAEMRGVEL